MDLSLLCFGYFNEAQIREKRSKYDKHYKIYILLSTVYNLFLLLSMEQCASLMIRPVLSVSSLGNVSKYIPSQTCIISGFTFVWKPQFTERNEPKAFKKAMCFPCENEENKAYSSKASPSRWNLITKTPCK